MRARVVTAVIRELIKTLRTHGRPAVLRVVAALLPTLRILAINHQALIAAPAAHPYGERRRPYRKARPAQSKAALTINGPGRQEVDDRTRLSRPPARLIRDDLGIWQSIVAPAGTPCERRGADAASSLRRDCIRCRAAAEKLAQQRSRIAPNTAKVAKRVREKITLRSNCRAIRC